MPIALIEVRKKYLIEQEMALMKAVHCALQETFKILNNDINVRLLVHEPHRSSLPSTILKAAEQVLENKAGWPMPLYYPPHIIDV